MFKYINKLKLFILSLLIVFALSNNTLTTFAFEGNQNTGEISINSATNSITVEEKLKIVLQEDSLERYINVNKSDINNISIELIYPSKENLSYTISDSKNNTLIQISLPGQKGREVILSLKYNLTPTDSIITALKDKTEASILYPDTNESLVRLNMSVKSSIPGVEEFQDTITNTSEHKAPTEKTNASKTNKSASKKSKSFFKVILDFIIDMVCLLLSTLAIAIIAFIGYVFYCRYRNNKKRKFNSNRSKANNSSKFSKARKKRFK